MGARATLATARPDVAAEWHPTKNGTRHPDLVAEFSNHKVWWRCAQGHEWQQVIAGRTAHDRPCRTCRKQKSLATDSLSARAPHIALEWHPTRNAPLTPDDVRHWDRRSVWWRCARGHEWRTRIESRVSRNLGCNECRKGESARRHCLADAVPAVAREWHPVLNGALTARDVSAGSGRRVWWRCAEGHEWQDVIHARARRLASCARCAGRLPGQGTCLADLNPALAREWHPTRNDRSPADVLPGSDYLAWWVCDLGHEWQRQVEVRNRGVGCNTCRLATPYERSLACLEPAIAAEWHPDRNDRLPSAVSRANAHRAWWRCPRGHEWQTSVSNRTVIGTGCPDCFQPSASKWEAALRESLAPLFGVEVEQARRPLAGMGQMGKVDMRIDHLRLVVEFDGAYWHRDREERDLRKVAILAAAGWRVIRVRQAPLRSLGRDSVVVAAKATVEEVTTAVMEQFMRAALSLDGKYAAR